MLGLVAAGAVSPGHVAADEPQRGRLLVPGDFFLPGATMTITGTDFDEGATIQLRLVSGSTAVDLARATVTPDRDFTAEATVPTSFPLGYAEVTATDAAGTVWSTVVLIGERNPSPVVAPGGLAIDERSIGRIGVVVGLVIFVVALLAWRRGRPPASRPG